ncbi:hypothetical protein MLD38_012655 [Melastoma candidum]|uniref:Uncharacterized protein n=1 Tax=Melastoma candidum TaxID=119954 RepID=A0ACB9R7L0_9MYRT|nr:hypothetical protein MLD38_012655 [Melastoma candidum]
MEVENSPAKRPRQKKKKKTDASSSSRTLNPNWALLQQKLSSHPTPSPPLSHYPKYQALGKRKGRPDEEGDASEPDPLAPTSTDFSVTDVLAMDCEMVGVGPEGTRSALGRVTLVNKWGNVVCDEFVRPLEHVTDFRTQVSGIRPRDMRKAKDFRLIQKKVAELIKGKVLVGHALHNDLKALLLSHPKKDIRDTSEYHLFRKEGRRKALRHLAAEFLGVTIQNGEHCPIEDARAAMLLYQRIHKAWEKSAKTEIRMKQKKRQKKTERVKIDTLTT